MYKLTIVILYSKMLAAVETAAMAQELARMD
jgi:hypothetical protein